MTRSGREFPVHEELTVVEEETIYRTDDWWKGIVRYYFRDDDERTEAAIYLWHNDSGEWTRKNKYTVKTCEAWEQDRPIVDALLTDATPDRGREADPSEVPVSDYYTVEKAYTVFQSDGWWKAIVEISQKGDYETTEVIVYVWQRTDDDWRRRQKYAIKDLDDWGDERELVESFLADPVGASETERTADEVATGDTDESTTISGELEALDEELKRTHLSSELAN